MKLSTRSLLLPAAFTLSLVACGVDTQTHTGKLIDSPVAGVSYTLTRSNGATVTGITNAEGSFTYINGDVIAFNVGNVVLGKVTAKEIITLNDLTQGQFNHKTVNLAVLLQSLDDDQNPGNGINITPAAHTLFKTASVDLNQPDISQNLATLLAGSAYQVVNRDLAREHYESTLASMGLAGGVYVTADGTYQITKTLVSIDSAFSTPSSSSPYATGIPFGIGSGLFYKGVDVDGGLLFYTITDRGANADSPSINLGEGATSATKVFITPDFVPSLAVVKYKNGRSEVIQRTLLKVAGGSTVTGLPLPSGMTGSSLEVPLATNLMPIRQANQAIRYDINGIDPEGVALDKEGMAWICDEYGPFIAKVNPNTGEILSKYIAGAQINGLPAVLSNRIPNRGMEGIAVAETGKVYAVVQSTLEIKKTVNSVKYDTSKTALFTRIVELDPITGLTKMYAYPINSGYSKAKDAKLGDIVAIPNSNGKKFVLIEQGKDKNGMMHHTMNLIDLSLATDISNLKTSSMMTVPNQELEFASAAELASLNVKMAAKKKLFDLKEADSQGNTFGWLAEKAEGLALLPDGQTLVLSNDNDFGIRSLMVDKTTGQAAVETDPTAYVVDLNGLLTLNGVLQSNIALKVEAALPVERPSRLWFIKLPKPILQY